MVVLRAGHRGHGRRLLQKLQKNSLNHEIASREMYMRGGAVRRPLQYLLSMRTAYQLVHTAYPLRRSSSAKPFSTSSASARLNGPMCWYRLGRR